MRIFAGRKSASIFKFYFQLVLILTILVVTVGVSRYAPPMKAGLNLLSNEIVDDFPPDLVVNIEEGNITSNRSFPIVLKSPDSLQSLLPPNVLVIDPQGEPLLLEQYDALILVTNTHIATLTTSGLQTSSMENIPKTSLSYKSISQVSQSLSSLASRAVFVVGAYYLIKCLFNACIVWPMYLLLFSLIMKVIYRKRIKGLRQSLKLSIHSFSIPIIIFTLAQALQVKITFTLLFIVVHVLFATFILNKLEQEYK